MTHEELQAALDHWRQKYRTRQDPEFYDVVRLLEEALALSSENTGLKEEKAALQQQLWVQEKKLAWMASRLRFQAGTSASGAPPGNPRKRGA